MASLKYLFSDSLMGLGAALALGGNDYELLLAMPALSLAGASAIWRLSRALHPLSRFSPMGDILNLGQVILLGLLCLIKIPPDLQIEPKIGRDTEKTS